jgi:hypothetical protein
MQENMQEKAGRLLEGKKQVHEAKSLTQPAALAGSLRKNRHLYRRKKVGPFRFLIFERFAALSLVEVDLLLAPPSRQAQKGLGGACSRAAR